MTTLIVAVGAYTAVHQSAFLGSYNLRNLLLMTMPLALVSLGQTSALLVGGFDVSVGALMTMCVVTASFTIQPGSSWIVLLVVSLAGTFLYLTRDNGYTVLLTAGALGIVDFDLGYTRSVPFRLDTVSFGIGFDFSPFFKKGRVR